MVVILGLANDYNLLCHFLIRFLKTRSFFNEINIAPVYTGGSHKWSLNGHSLITFLSVANDHFRLCERFSVSLKV